MDPYVLALQLYLFNKACGGLPLRIAEQVVVTGVINTAWWTAKTVGSCVIWLVRPSTTSRQQSTTCENKPITTINIDEQFEIIMPEQITELEKDNKQDTKR